MADDSVVKVRFLAITSDLKSGIDSVQSSLSGLADKATSAGGAVTGLLAVGAVAALVQMSKAAEDDARSQFVLAAAIRNNTDESAAGVKQAEAYITSLQNSAAIADDELRPALATLVRATHDVTSAQQLLGLSADVAAGTGRDLGSVADALSKAYEGNTKSLKMLAPEITGLIKDGATAGEVFDALAASYKGNAEGLADVSPWQKLQVQLGEAAEKIGVALLPTIELLADVVEKDVGPTLEELGPVINATADAFVAMAKPVVLIVEAVDKLGQGTAWLGDKLGIGSEGAGELEKALAKTGDTAKDTAPSFAKLTQATTATTAAYDENAASAKNVAARLRDLKSATFDLPDAQHKVADGWASIDDAAKQAGGTTRDVERDMRDIRDASEGLAAAQKNLTKAEQDLADARKPASARTKAQAERDVTEALIKRMQATNKVGEIEAKIKAVPKDGSAESADEITKANLELGLAKLEVKKAYDDAEIAAENLNAVMDVGKDTTDAVKSATDDLASAQRAVRDATEAVTDAQKAATETGGAHEDKTKAIAAAYENQKKNIWDTVEAMHEQGKSQEEIDAFIATSGTKLDEYANKYKLAKGDVDAFKDSLFLLALQMDDKRLGAATAGNLVPPVWTQGGGAGTTMTANSAEYRLSTPIVNVYIGGERVTDAVIKNERAYN